jgi:UDP-glucose 4-epimerase
MRVLLTGATGFIGSHLLERLLAQGEAVTALVVPETLDQLLHRDRVKVVLGTLNDGGALARATEGVQVVLHAGGKILGSTRPDLVAVNVHGTANLLKAAVKNRVQRFVLVSSTSVYVHALSFLGLHITEDSPLGPTGRPSLVNYGESKMQAERLVLQFHQRYGLGYSIVRPTIAYGPGDGLTPEFLEGLLARILRNEALALSTWAQRPKMQWVHVEDLAEVILRAALWSQGLNEIFNTAGAEMFSIQTLAAMMLNILRPASLVPWSRSYLSPTRYPFLIYDISRAQRLLAYEPKIDLQIGLAEMLRDMKRRGLIPAIWSAAAVAPNTPSAFDVKRT